MQELLVPDESVIEIDSDSKNITLCTNDETFRRSLNQAFQAREVVIVKFPVRDTFLLLQILISRSSIIIPALYPYEFNALIEESYVSLS